MRRRYFNLCLRNVEEIKPCQGAWGKMKMQNRELNLKFTIFFHGCTKEMFPLYLRENVLKATRL